METKQEINGLISMTDGQRQRPFHSRKIFQNFGFLTAGRIAGDAFTFLMFVVLSRTFGQKGIGEYSFAMALAGFLVIFSEVGLYHLTIKELSRIQGPLGTAYGAILSLRLILSIIVFGVLLLALPFVPGTHEFKLIMLIIGLYQIIIKLAESASTVFIAREDTHLAGLMEASFRAVSALSVIAIVMAGGRLVTALTALPVLAIGQVLVSHILVARRYGRPQLRTSRSSLAKTIRETVPYGLSAFLAQLHMRTDIVLLGFILGAAAAGVYNVGYRVVFLLMFIPQFASVSLFPLASRLYKSSQDDLEVLYHKSMKSIITIGLPMAAGLWLIAPDLIKTIFGTEFTESGMILRILAWLFLFNFAARFLGVFLMSCDRQVKRTKCQWIVASVNVLGNILLIPVMGIKGAAIATLTSETLLVLLFAIQMRSVFGWPQVSSRFVISCAGVTSFCLPFTLFPSSMKIVIPISILLYCCTLLVFKEIRQNEAKMITGFLKR